jgi:hypothetical protein
MGFPPRVGSAGFIETGEIDHGEIVMVKTLSRSVVPDQ